MPSHQSAVSTLIREVLADPDLAHDEEGYSAGVLVHFQEAIL